ncbi:MAG: glycerophosphodiester phosphodiesterase [Gammaproteobacteria bacterium]|nr:MAG: glycerophosphodiester phosphodiesterase [Gammaproteobacteria bacterium]
MADFSANFYIIGHRGAAGELFENSLEGIEYALTLGIDMIEIDIRQHSSGLWVIHDHDLERLTGTAGLFEEHADPSAIRLLNGEPVPTLQQVLDLTWGKLPLNIEIKAVDDLELLLDQLAGYPRLPPAKSLPWILISSFNHKAIARLRQLDCPWPLAPISTGIALQIQAELDQIAPSSWHFDNDYVEFDLVRELREQGIPSFVFTVNSVERAEVLRQHGVAGIFTDFPSKMIEIFPT